VLYKIRHDCLMELQRPSIQICTSTEHDKMFNDGVEHQKCTIFIKIEGYWSRITLPKVSWFSFSINIHHAHVLAKIFEIYQNLVCRSSCSVWFQQTYICNIWTKIDHFHVLYLARQMMRFPKMFWLFDVPHKSNLLKNTCFD